MTLLDLAAKALAASSAAAWRADRAPPSHRATVPVRSWVVGARRGRDPALRLRPLTCPVRALEAWIVAADLCSGELFCAVDQLGMVSD